MTGPAVNSPDYWEARFASGDWGARGGPAQSRFFAELALSLVPPAVADDLRARRASVCDWGCGEGEGAAALAAAWGTPVTGLDVSPAAVERASGRHAGVSFAVSRAGLDREYDVLFTSNTLEHFAAPWGVLASLLPRVGRYVLLLVPFEERERIEEHAYTFELESFPLEVGGFELVDLRVAHCAGIEGSWWAGDQALATYARRGAEGIPLRLEPALAAGVARAAALAEARHALTQERDALRAERDALAAEGEAARARLASLRAEAAHCAQRLEADRARRSYVLARAVATLREHPVSAAVAAWDGTTGRVEAAHARLRGWDSLADGAASLRAAVAASQE
ncbi:MULTISPECIES: methyltransferase domain-containing protein [unclassified Anaeromyxobacter]|uniref:methyltransferase domain-containing protein n=1 Tax=unclassified Anaeromyxobacter TaxID=2620896 RepID=UPI001F580B01|nr:MULTISPECIES: methyltransferase domain-containing protein [unclassified Anaeromyxobacter]